ncbi:MAG: methylmalonyl-CoA epimerase [Planctomycetota bacterium]|jgi:methylmalonyl-CoA/ethylmalonyl-CoA epimerase
MTHGPPRLAHLGIAVEGHAQALLFWRDLLGLPLEHTEHVASDGVTVAMLRLGSHPPPPLGDAAAGAGGHVELLQPDAGDNPVRGFLDKRGPGIHHLALEVDDLEALHARLKAAGIRLIDDAPRPGAHGTTVCFVHPKSTGGVLVELVQARG